MLVRPVDLPLLRDETAEWVTRSGPAVYERAIHEGRQLMRPVGSPTKAAATLTDAEVRRLKDAELFYVTEDMTELAVAAGRSLPEFTLMPEDLPSPSGLILFEKPIAAVDYSQWYENEGESPIVAASWSHWTGGNPHWVNGGVWITWYADRDASLASALERGIYSPEKVEGARRVAGRLLVDNESQGPFSREPLGVSTKDGEVTIQEASGVARWLATLRAAWLLMSQPVSSVKDAEYDRAARRRIQKQGKEPPRVRVITLRRPASAGSGGSGRDYHHQWVVRGHWRQQWYSARQVHRPVWIAPHIKGPEGAPMLGGEKVYAWSR